MPLNDFHPPAHYHKPWLKLQLSSLQLSSRDTGTFLVKKEVLSLTHVKLTQGASCKTALPVTTLAD